MTEVAIHVENLGKQYLIGGSQASYSTFRETLVDAFKTPFRRAARLLGGRPSGAADLNEAIWALKEVSFEVRKGDVVGIIGRNGAGKSTLLKILSRITEPTEGYAEIKGRVGSLLEVGTGFHPELTGRENVYLNGAILGMRKTEIRRKFDEIVSFAEVEKFIDTPVKHYSSGMYLRLAFAVAAHLEPEIMLVDEVLAVGDAQFQKKCMGKMRDVSRQGRTILFVSHNLQAVKQLCDNAILLKDGRLQQRGDTESIVNAYLSTANIQGVNVDIPPERHRDYPPDLEIFQLELLSENNEPISTVLVDEVFSICIHYKIRDAHQSYRIGIVFRSNDGGHLATIVNTNNGMPHLSGQSDTSYHLTVGMRNVFLPGDYFLDIHVKSFFNKSVDIIEGIRFSVEALSAGTSSGYGKGIVRLDAKWSLPEQG